MLLDGCWSLSTHRAEAEPGSSPHARPVEARRSNTMRKEYDLSKGKRGAFIPSPGKTRITIMLDDDVIEFFRSKAEAEGTGYQTMINASLREALSSGKRKRTDDQPVTVTLLRKGLREELNAG